MRVLHLIDHLNAGGAQTLLLALAKQQRRTGIGARVLALHGPGRFTDHFKTAHIPVGHAAPSRTSPAIPVAVIRAVNTLRPDIIHAHLVVSSALAEWLRPAFPHPTPVLCHLHNTHAAHGEDAYQDKLENLLYRRCDLAIACGREVARTLRNRPSRCTVPIATVPNAIETSRLAQRNETTRQATRATLAIRAEAPMLLCVGRLVRQKNIEYAVRIAAQLATTQPAARILIAGDGPERAAIRARIASLRVESTVQLLGYRNDIPELFQAADALLMTSTEEGFPMVALEAGATGLPTIATPFAAATEFITPGTTGILIPFDDPGGAARIIADTFAHPDLLPRIGANARDLVAARHTMPVLAAHLTRLYEGIMTNKRASRQ